MLSCGAQPPASWRPRPPTACSTLSTCSLRTKDELSALRPQVPPTPTIKEKVLSVQKLLCVSSTDLSTSWTICASLNLKKSQLTMLGSRSWKPEVIYTACFLFPLHQTDNEVLPVLSQLSPPPPPHTPLSLPLYFHCCHPGRRTRNLRPGFRIAS